MAEVRILTTPDLDAAEVIVTGCAHGRKRQSVVVPNESLRMAARQIGRSREQIAEARQRERLPGNVHTMGYRASTQSFGIGHMEVRCFGPNVNESEWVDGRSVPAEEVRGKLEVRIWTRRRGYPALAVLVDETSAQTLANVLWDASQPPGRVEYRWAENEGNTTKGTR